MTFLLYFLFITLPLGAVIRIEFFLSAYVYPVDVAVFLIAFYSVFSYQTYKQLFSTKLFRSYLIFIGILFLSLLVNIFSLKSSQFIVAFLYLIRFILYSNLLFIVSFIPQSKRKKMFTLLIFSGFITILFGFIQYAYYPALRNLYYLGWDEHLYRMFSTFLDPNFAGIFFVLVFWGLVYMISSVFVGTKNIFKFSFLKQNKYALFWGVCIVLASIAIFLTYSRSAEIAWGVSILVYFFSLKNKKITFGILTLLIISFILIPKSTKIENLNPFRTASIFERAEQYQNAITLFSKSPVLGVGFDAYRYAQIRHGYLKTNVTETHAGAGVPNSYLFLLATSGIVGFTAFLSFWVNVFKWTWNLPPLQKTFLIVSLTALGVHSLFENSLFYPFVMVWIFLMIGLHLSIQKE